MSVAPSRVNTFQEWEEIPIYTEKISCHVCSKQEQVKQGDIQVYDEEPGKDFPGPTKHYLLNCKHGPWLMYWQLCQTCYDQGWRVIAPFVSSFLLYTNERTKEYKFL